MICFDDITIICTDCNKVLDFCSSDGSKSAIFSCPNCKKGIFVQRVNKEMVL